MRKQDMHKMQTYVLKVNIHCVCDGCKDKVKKLIQKTEGVYQTNVDAEQGKVVVSGVVDPDKLIKKLKKSGKHAELWGVQKGNLANGQNFPANQFNSFGNGKGGKDNKSHQQKGGQSQQKGGHFEPVKMKGAKDMKLPSKDQKSVKFNLPEDFDGSDDDFDGSEAYDDEFDVESDDDFEVDECEFGHGQHTANKTMPMMGNGSKGGPTMAMINDHPMNASKNGDGKGANMNFKKGGAIDFPFEMNSDVGKPHGKDGKGGKNGGGHVDSGGEKNKKGGKNKGRGGGGSKKGAAEKSGGGLLGFLRFGKKSKKGEAVAKRNKSNHEETVSSGAGHHKVKKGKNGGVDFDDFPDMDVMSHNIKDDGSGGGNGGKGGNGGGGVKVGQMGQSSVQMGAMNSYPMGQMGQMSKIGNFPMDQARGFAAVHGLPAHAASNGGGYNYQGQAMQPQPSYQQYMPIMMNPQQHQAANGNGGIYQPMMYGNHHPSMNYMPPPPMPSHPMNDPMTHIFSDENTESCSIM